MGNVLQINYKIRNVNVIKDTFCKTILKIYNSTNMQFQ